MPLTCADSYYGTMTKIPDYPNCSDTEDFERMAASVAGKTYAPPKRTYSQRTDDHFATLRRRGKAASFNHALKDVGRYYGFASCTASHQKDDALKAEAAIRYQHNAEGYQFALPPIEDLSAQQVANMMHVLMENTRGIGIITATPDNGSRFRLAEMLSGKECRAQKSAVRSRDDSVAVQAIIERNGGEIPTSGEDYEKYRDILYPTRDHGFSVDITLEANPNGKALFPQLVKIAALIDQIESYDRMHIDWPHFSPEAVAARIERDCQAIQRLRQQPSHSRQEEKGIWLDLVGTANIGYLARAREYMIYGDVDAAQMLTALADYQPSPLIRCAQTDRAFRVSFLDGWTEWKNHDRDGAYKTVLNHDHHTIRFFFGDTGQLDMFATAAMNLLKPPCRQRKIPLLHQERSPLASAHTASKSLDVALEALPKKDVRIKPSKHAPAYQANADGVIETGIGRR